MIVEKTYNEGRTTFLSADIEHYSGTKKQISAGLPVFYNPRMRLNRDLSILFLSSYLRFNKIDSMCEPLTGSGVRTLRYLNECPGEFKAKMFDVNPNAVEIASKNIKSLGLERRAQVIRGDAKVLLLTESRETRFDYVDIDPFGSPAPYLNAAIQSLSPEGGLLALTATDMPVLCGRYQQVALRRYGGVPVKTPFIHEIAVRLLQSLALRIAGLNDYSITPLAILSSDHFVRTWVKINPEKYEFNQYSENLGTIRYCHGCMQTQIIPQEMKYEEPVFEHSVRNCKGLVQIAGPLWIGNLFDTKLLQNAQDTFKQDDSSCYHKRVSRVLEEMIEESSMVIYPFIDLHALCDLHNLTPPRNSDMIDYLKTIGYHVSRTHFKPTAIRTNAPVEDIVSAICTLKKR